MKIAVDIKSKWLHPLQQPVLLPLRRGETAVGGTNVLQYFCQAFAPRHPRVVL